MKREVLVILIKRKKSGWRDHSRQRGNRLNPADEGDPRPSKKTRRPRSRTLGGASRFSQQSLQQERRHNTSTNQAPHVAGTLPDLIRQALPRTVGEVVLHAYPADRNAQDHAQATVALKAGAEAQVGVLPMSAICLFR